MICKYANIHKKNPEFKVNKIKKIQNLNTFLFVFF